MGYADWADNLNAIISGQADGTTSAVPSPTQQKKLSIIPGIPLPGDWDKRLGTVVPGVVQDIASAPTGLWALADIGTNWASKQVGFGDKHIPGGQAALDATVAIREPFQKVMNDVTGEETDYSLLKGEPSQLAAAWLRLGLGAGLRAPAMLVEKLHAGASKINLGNEIANKIGANVLKGAEYAIPLNMSKNPGIATTATSIGVGGAVGTGIEMLIDPSTRPNFGGSDDGASVPDVNNTVNTATAMVKDAGDHAVSGAAEVAPALGQVDSHAPTPTHASMLTGNDALDASLLAIGGVAAIYGHKARVFDRVMGRLSGVAPADRGTRPGAETFRHNYIDEGAPVKNVYEELSKTMGFPIQDSQAFAGKYDSRRGAAIDTKLDIFHEFGELPDSKISVPAVRDMMQKVAGWDDATKKLFVDAANGRWSLNFRHHIANDLGENLGRVGTGYADAKYLQGVARGLDEGKTAYNHFDDGTGKAVPGQELLNNWNAGLNHPEVGPVLKDFQKITNGILDYLVEQKARTPSEVKGMRERNPNYFPVPLGKNGSYFDAVDKLQPKSGANIPGNPMESILQYAEEAIRMAEFNKVKADFVTSLQHARDYGNPEAKAIADRLIGRENIFNPGTEKGAGEKFVQYRDRITAAPRTIEVHEPTVRTALQNGSNLASLHMIAGAAARPARLFENAAVGPISLALSHNLFAIKGALYNLTFGTTHHQPGFANSPVDKLAQSMTGGKLKANGEWLSMLPLAAAHAATGFQAVLAKQAARAVRNSIISDGPIAKMLNSSMSPTTAQSVADSLTNRFKKNWVYAFQKEGLMGPANQGAQDMSRIIRDAQQKMATSGLKPSVINESMRFISDLLHTISTSPNAAFHTLNKGNANKDALNFAVREFGGDPSRSGAFKGPVGKTVGIGSSVTPWGNIYLQTADRDLRGIGRDPVGFARGIAMGIGTTAVGAMLWNMRLGPEYLAWQFGLNGRTPDAQASNIYIGIPGQTPEQGLEIPVDPLRRIYKHAIEMAAGHFMGALDGSIWHPENEGLRRSLSEAIGSRQLSFGQGSVPRALFDQSVAPPMTPLVGVPLAMSGVKSGSYTDMILGPHRAVTDNKQKGFTESSGADPFRNFLGLYESAEAENILRAIGAQSLVLAHDMYGQGEKIVKQGGGAMDVAKNTVGVWNQSGGDTNKYASGLFGHIQNISPSSDPRVSLARDKMNNVKEILQSYAATTNGGAPGNDLTGSVTRGFQKLVGGPISVQAEDPAVREIAYNVKVQNQLWTPKLGTIRDAFDQRQSALNDTRSPPAERRKVVNAISLHIIDQYDSLLQDVQRFEATMSKKFGVRVKLDKMDMGKPITQFKPLLPN